MVEKVGPESWTMVGVKRGTDRDIEQLAYEFSTPKYVIVERAVKLLKNLSQTVVE